MISAGLKKRSWVRLTREFRNIATSNTPSFLTLVRCLQLLGRIFDENLQMMEEEGDVVWVVLAFDEFDALLDWRKAASERDNGPQIGFSEAGGVKGASYDIRLDLLAPFCINSRWATRMLEPTPRFGVRNVAIHIPSLS